MSEQAPTPESQDTEGTSSVIAAEQAEHAAHQGGLAGAVGADEGDDAAGIQGQADLLEHRLPGKGHADLLQPDQRLAHACFRQAAH